MIPALSAWRRLDDARHRAEFYRQWSLAADAGFTIPRAMETMGARDDVDVERARRAVLEGARRGRSLADIVRAPAASFSPFERGLLSLGDESGSLDRSLRLLASYEEQRHRWMLAVRKRLAYPLFTALCASFIAPFPLVMAGQVGAYVTVVAVACIAWLAGGGVVIAAMAARYGRAPHLVRARLARALGTAIEAGLPLGRALRLAAAASDDADIERFIGSIADRALDTQPLVVSLSACPRMTPEFLAVLANAERTGDFTGTLVRLADLYEDGFR